MGESKAPGGAGTRVSFEDWTLVSPPTSPSRAPALVPDRREQGGLWQDEEDEDAMRMGRRRKRAETQFNVDALLR